MSSQLQSSSVHDAIKEKDRTRVIKISRHVKSISNTLSGLIGRIDERQRLTQTPGCGEMKNQVFRMFEIQNSSKSHDILFPGLLQKMLLSFAARRFKRLVCFLINRSN